MQQLLADIEAFLAETGMGPAYFGRLACKDTTLVRRLRKGGRVWPDKEAEIRAFISSRRLSMVPKMPKVNEK